MRSKDGLITSPFGKPDSSTASDEPGRLTGPMESHLGTLTLMAMIPVGTVFLLATTLVLTRSAEGTAAVITALKY